MRTKAIILSAALVAAGVASSMAQSNVYSLNVVGYVNLTLTNGFNLITLPLQSSDVTSSINSVLTNTTPTTPFGAYVLQWNPAASSFTNAVYAGGDGNWYDGGFDYLVSNSVPPGQGFFFFLPGPGAGGVASMQVTVVGTVLQGTNSYTENTGYGFYGNFEPVQGDITTNGFPITADYGYLYQWNAASQSYTTAVYGIDAADNAPSPAQFYNADFTQVVVVAPPVGAGFVYFNPGSAASWTQTFTVQ
jgi:hypothetical protein